MTTQKDFDTIENEHFVLKGRLSAPEYFAEGVTHLFFGYPLTKVLFHNVIDPKNASQPEIRKAGQYLTMPTVRVIEFAHLILSTAKQMEERLMGDLNPESKEKVGKILNNFQLNDLVSLVALPQTSPAPKARVKKKISASVSGAVAAKTSPNPKARAKKKVGPTKRS